VLRKREPAPTCVHTARPRNAQKERQARNMQSDSNTQVIADGIQQERSATIGSREVVSLGTPDSCLALGFPLSKSLPVSNRQIPKLRPYLTAAKSTSMTSLIAKIRANRASLFFVLDVEAPQRHLKSAPHYAYLSRHTFERLSARRERAAYVFGLKSRNSNRLCCRLEFDATHCKQTTDANSNRRKTGT
jgi:hypothetical protein